MRPVSTPRKLLASLTTIGLAAGLMAFGTFGQFTAGNAGFPQSSLADRP
jgi:hypothetical protein